MTVVKNAYQNYLAMSFLHVGSKSGALPDAPVL